jgi:hypothetical protein
MTRRQQFDGKDVPARAIFEGRVRGDVDDDGDRVRAAEGEQGKRRDESQPLRYCGAGKVRVHGRALLQACHRRAARV